MESSFSQRAEEERKLLAKNPNLLNVLLAKERTIESKLRTTLSVINTAAAIAAFGFGLLKFFEENTIARDLAYFLMFCSFLITLYAIKRFMHYHKESGLIKRHRADLAELIE
ncbi:DUF202 domain-containing protein [Candidatus Micrarchaeota archaeon]|nr:DUF202 domain-containing protein [Candidatus Micrarchaeota archaeon]MBU2476136.1 DUF202 domain-containing protein [Candidatus Micrarchaeota archaeon]